MKLIDFDERWWALGIIVGVIIGFIFGILFNKFIF